MAACSDTEEKPSSPKESLPLKICVENSLNHDIRKNCCNESRNVSKNHETFSEVSEKSKADVNTLSEDEFLQLMIEASTFNKSTKQESALLKQLRSDNPITDTEPSDKATLLKNPHFSVQRNSKHCIGTSSSFNSTSSYLRTSDRKKHSKNKEEYSSKNASSVNALQKGIHQSQSLQDLMSSDLSKSKQKSHKAHRTHSLSSDEVTGIEADSLIIPKNSKKFNKQLSSGSNSGPKSEVNKTSSRNNLKASQNLELNTIDLEDKAKSNGSKESSNYQSLSDSDIPTVNCRKEQSDEKHTLSSPVEIEMDEIKSVKKSSNGEESSSGKEVEKAMNGPIQSNSKFYVDCNDIDTTVTFPLKLVSSIDDQNNGPLNEQMKRFPLVPWPRPLQVQSFFSSFPMEDSRNDKQLTDINGNPFARNARSTNLASFVSSSLMDYSNSGLVLETKNRKNKRLRNALNKGVLAENIAGHRGEEDIDTLLQYINSSDKKMKSAVKGNSPNQVVSNKNSVLHENERKKSIGKEVKNCQKSVINVKKKLTRSNSLESMSTTMTNDVSVANDTESVFTYETVSDMNSSVKGAKAQFEPTDVKNLDINSNEESKPASSNETNFANSVESSLCNNIGQSSLEVSSFASDFYSTSNVSSQTCEESGFLIVKKKQRKKQSKRSDSFRWRNAQNQRKKGMMLPLAESKCGKQDSRRKSTSSVPHSEHSSADNSDLDSVHSLPVRGSVPHPTQSHPHTTPSSSSSTPQASYADIARMPISKLNSTSPSIITYSAQASTKPHTGEQEVKRTDGNGYSSVKRKVSDSREHSLVVKSMSRSPASDKECDTFSTSDVKIRSHAKSTREINTQTEPENIIVDTSKVENLSSKNKKIDESLKQLCNSCLKKNSCSCPKPPICPRQKGKNMDFPPVIMDNIPSNTYSLSFGIGIDEVLKLSTAKSDSTSLDLGQKNIPKISSMNKIVDTKKVEVLDGKEGIFEISSVNSNANAESCCKSSSSLEVTSKTLHSQDLKNEQSSHLKTICYGSGRNICYIETEVNVKKFNQSEITNFLGNEFHNIQKEIESISKSSKNSSKVKYYVDSSEEA
ncbi:uncharacterized protein TNIN_67531 [Trichonephila inaurata madagascariensis]|uniref:Uncharacterized protein n=1 Tax=Trichonephila inaurata madagascariensis TaxID=2747483 RepID=A0A8X6IGR7_9ARAC|nr:uncharacterized protein TNIN_67531 [Trichonephila inaurata madagascariensis]